MKRWFRGFRQAKDLREREERRQAKEELGREVRSLIARYGYEGEAMYRRLLKDRFPKMTEAEIEEDVKLYRVAVSERRSQNADWR
ncbi:MAG TPA: hypothetical protein VKQ11_05380 [Candidatus Sulfotelmatobacter sp.]|nr:hypothetical protein [Candidatus Sulfotelmatobacter sp.]